MMAYARPQDRSGALRLHLNENTGGCSHAVVEAIREITAEEIACYPDYDVLVREVAEYLGVPENQLVLTNGLDEGLLALAVSALRVSNRPVAPIAPFEAIIPMPAFEMYSVFVNAAGGRVIAVPPSAGFEFQLDGICKAITDRTRLVFLTNPNNPTGQLVPRDAIRTIARAVPADATVVIDEAYVDFSSETFLSELNAYPNVVIGRTFAKAHGLAGLRAGCVIGAPGRMDLIREVVPPYSLSVFAVAGWRAALRDREYLDWYRAQVVESRELLYAACDRLNLPYWKSGGNFVLIDVRRAGNPREIADAFANRGVLIRDRSRDQGCDGCIRITAGLVRHTEIAVEVLEGLCAVP